MFKITAISISDRKGIRKKNIQSGRLLPDFGLESDAHGGQWHRQISFLAEESIKTMRDKGLDVVAGNFAENITTAGLDLTSLAVGTHVRIGEAELVISQLGKICHTRCAIYHQAGDCVMPREGIFGVVLQGGTIQVGDSIRVQDKHSEAAAIISTKEIETSSGDQLKMIIKEKLKPAFIRFDTISSKEGGSLPAILEDLTTTQQIKNIFVFDPSGNMGLALMDLARDQERPHRLLKNGSLIDYCRTREELEKILN